MTRQHVRREGPPARGSGRARMEARHDDWRTVTRIAVKGTPWVKGEGEVEGMGKGVQAWAGGA